MEREEERGTGGVIGREKNIWRETGGVIGTERGRGIDRRREKGEERERGKEWDTARKRPSVHPDYILLLDMLLPYRNVLVMPIEEGQINRQIDGDRGVRTR